MFYKALSSPCFTERNVQFRFSCQRDFELIGVFRHSNATSCSTVSENMDKLLSHLGGRGPLVHFVADLGDHGAVRHSGGGALRAKQHTGRLYSVKYQNLSGHYIFSFICFFSHLFWADLFRNSAFSPICKKHIQVYVHGRGPAAQPARISIPGEVRMFLDTELVATRKSMAVREPAHTHIEKNCTHNSLHSSRNSRAQKGKGEAASGGVWRCEDHI